MKTHVATLLIMALLCAGLTAYPQDPVKKKVKKKTEKKADEKIDKTIDKGFKKLEGLFKKKNKDDKKQQEKEQQVTAEKQASHVGGTEAQAPDLNWSRYDFVPGEHIIFEDGHEKEENGEFPSRWDLVKGAAENAEFDGQKVIYFRSGDTKIIPYLKNSAEDYLPERFTLEFDTWFEKDKYAGYFIWLYDGKNQKRLSMDPIDIHMNAIDAQRSFVIYPGVKHGKNGEQSIWRHVSLSFNKRSLKIYLDDARLINIPNLGIDPTGITIGCDRFAPADIGTRFIKNIRLAEGAVKLYDRILSDGKIVSNGIRFDVNKATLKPESMGVINEICQLMGEHPELRFSVEGHTDSDGETDFNQRLSEQRAETVRGKLVEMGIDPARLATKGFGETIPVAPNDTPEGKATNRRVEFINIQKDEAH
ncbi:MAG: OmpA family protein [Bacteroidales bacterium]|nr:OmpA family protein [Bacteroidales bacterium]